MEKKRVEKIPFGSQYKKLLHVLKIEVRKTASRVLFFTPEVWVDFSSD